MNKLAHAQKVSEFAKAALLNAPYTICEGCTCCVQCGASLRMLLWMLTDWPESDNHLTAMCMLGNCHLCAMSVSVELAKARKLAAIDKELEAFWGKPVVPVVTRN